MAGAATPAAANVGVEGGERARAALSFPRNTASNHTKLHVIGDGSTETRMHNSTWPDSLEHHFCLVITTYLMSLTLVLLLFHLVERILASIQEVKKCGVRYRIRSSSGIGAFIFSQGTLFMSVSLVT